MGDTEYSDIVHGLYNLSAQGVESTDVRFKQLLAALAQAREKRGPLDTEYYGMKGSTRNPVSSAQFERTLDQISVASQYLSVGLEAPDDLLRRCGVDTSAATDDSDKNTASNYAEIMHYAEALHRDGDRWSPSLGWIEYAEAVSENRLAYTLNAVNNLRSMLEFVMSKGSSEGMDSVEALINKLGMEKHAARFRNNGMLRTNKFLSALLRLERQLRLLILQRNFKRSLRLSRHFFLSEPSKPHLWSVRSGGHDWNEHLNTFFATNRDGERMRAKIARYASQRMEAWMRRMDPNNADNGYVSPVRSATPDTPHFRPPPPVRPMQVNELPASSLPATVQQPVVEQHMGDVPMRVAITANEPVYAAPGSFPNGVDIVSHDPTRGMPAAHSESFDSYVTQQ
ncbi:helicase family member protein [Babesia caballi]|uniref:Helicase family member protein n=1 Tax=Babesia caballi TaxID=5871 RepID=A0AAV4LW13_BABCB|nr:helicase family member protein [Babesia caballi]